MKPSPSNRLHFICVAFLFLKGLCLGAPTLSEEALSQPREFRNPEELLIAIARFTKPDWAANFRGPLPSTINSRVQTAVLIGSVFADGYLAAQAEDAQQCKNVVKDLISLAKTLGVQNELLDRSRSLADSAQKKAWPAFRQELSAMEAELGNTLRKHQDERLVGLVILGAWLRGLEISASVLKENYHENGTLFLRQKSVLKLLQSELDLPPDSLKPDPLMLALRPRLEAVRSQLEGPSDATLSPVDLKTLASTLTAILQEIITRQN